VLQNLKCLNLGYDLIRDPSPTCS